MADAELIKRLEDVFKFREDQVWHHIRADLLKEVVKRLKELSAIRESE